jgi:hypothetical protein
VGWKIGKHWYTQVQKYSYSIQCSSNDCNNDNNNNINEVGLVAINIATVVVVATYLLLRFSRYDEE